MITVYIVQQVALFILPNISKTELLPRFKEVVERYTLLARDGLFDETTTIFDIFNGITSELMAERNGTLEMPFAEGAFLSWISRRNRRDLSEIGHSTLTWINSLLSSPLE